ncbi:hypothetical protein MMC11_006374 [Xylographa trunciseda]|nr:hypothetical protein [Xylographa trunciseda]
MSQHQRDSPRHTFTRLPIQEAPVALVPGPNEATLTAALQTLSLESTPPDDVLLVPFTSNGYVAPLHQYSSYRLSTPVTFVPAGQAPKTGTKSGQTPKPTRKSKGKGSGWSTASRYQQNLETNYMMGMAQDQNWGLCDKDCAWCGHCAEACGY